MSWTTDLLDTPACAGGRVGVDNRVVLAMGSPLAAPEGCAGRHLPMVFDLPGHETVMRTQLSQFCQHFDTTLRPLLEPLQAAVRAVSSNTDEIASALNNDLVELQHQIEALAEKVGGQQAYVLIFGPLKSGKSTLMNAIAASYVSEVSSLPAYPCMVFVSHGKNREYVLTDYTGKTETLTDTEILHRRVEQAHTDLADAIRGAESTGELFEPQEHFPSAIRRIDVRVPAENLIESGAVLVDTPGLYTRMRFGYDRMTRDFRNAAACAIFVVKSDTLFLEQVFSEFNTLLEMFSRIFLVVNMDANKRDVGPGGELLPSLEQRDPDKIISAFENLAMSAPLREAAEQGRLRIYPVDLMSAARAALQGGDDHRVPADFASFGEELTRYLASTDYLVAFLRDSLHRADTLLGELMTITEGADVMALRDELQDNEERHRATQQELDRIQDALSRDWKPAFLNLHAELKQETERGAQDKGARVSRAMLAAIDTWFLSSHSLEWLFRHEWAPLVRDFREAVQQAALWRLEQSYSQRYCGLDLDGELADLLRAAGVDLVEVRKAAAAAIGSPEWSIPSPVPLRAEDIPIKKGVLDLVTFRSAEAVRRRLFGSNQEPDQKIESKVKMSRLGEAAKHYMRQRVMDFFKDLSVTTVAATWKHFGSKLREATVAELQSALAARQPQLAEAGAGFQRGCQRLRDLLAPLEKLHVCSGEVQSRLHALASQYSKADPEALLEPDYVLPIPPEPPQTREPTNGKERSRGGQRSRSRE